MDRAVDTSEAAPVAHWDRPDERTPDPTDVARVVEVSLYTLAPSRVSDEQLVYAVQGILGARRQNWPKWLDAIEIDGVYEEGDDE